MTIGPIQLLAITFPHFEQADGTILSELLKLNKHGTIRLVDLQYVRKDDEGNISMMEMSGLTESEQVEFGSVLAGMLGADPAEPTPEFTELLMAVEDSYGLSLGDFMSVANKIRPGSAAALLLIEHTWATHFSELVGKAGGHMVAQGFLTADAMKLVGKELDAQVKAIRAVEVSQAIQMEAAARAAQAIALSEAIQDEAATRAVEALVAANLIEAEAIDHAISVVVAAELVEEAAIDEAQQVVAAAEEIKAIAAVEAVSALIASEIIQQEAAEEAIDALVASSIIQDAARQQALAAVAEAKAVEDEA